MIRFAVAPALLLYSMGCANNSVDDAASDAEAESADVQTGQVEAASGVIGLYTTSSTDHQDGDILVVQLDSVGANPLTPSDLDYVRSRCYHDDCSAQVPESDRYDIYVSSSGKTYVRFWSFIVDNDQNGRSKTPKLADAYEMNPTTTGIELRKSATARWQKLDRGALADRCTASNGRWASDACVCPTNAASFVPGAGGCIAAPMDSETNCDNSGGMWTDDDQTLTGSYCACGIGRYDNPTGSCAEI